ncbi:hypothetical protein FKW77_002292 [Venturia effusa]|uniref:Uncharacterized protein n=1 Tax=Venturia effusa TaxID=50376 RepID=A0A517L6T9_9PEZI|nr:hypothetical protein FKW77_002292 [Venturia effusa]
MEAPSALYVAKNCSGVKRDPDHSEEILAGSGHPMLCLDRRNWRREPQETTWQNSRTRPPGHVRVVALSIDSLIVQGIGKSGSPIKNAIAVLMSRGERAEAY